MDMRWKCVRETFDGIGVAGALFDGALRLTSCSSSLAGLLQLPDRLIVQGTPLARFLPYLKVRGCLGPRDSDLLGAWIRTQLDARIPCRWSFVDGSGRRIQGHAKVLLDGGLLATFRDVSQAWPVAGIDAAAQAAGAAPADRATQRIEEASRAKSLLLARLSHELRSPLNGIVGFAQLMRSQAGCADLQARGIAAILSCAEHVLELTQDLLDLSSLEAAPQPPASAPVDLNAFLATLADTVGVQAQSKGLALLREFDLPQDCVVLLDETRLRQVLFNLLGNALKFTPAGAVTLRVSGSGAQRVERLRFEVSDTGPGIPQESMERVFLPFERLAHQRQTPGAGLGLYISRSLVRLMGSDIHVRSQPGRGTSFAFELKLDAAPASMAPWPERWPDKVASW